MPSKKQVWVYLRRGKSIPRAFMNAYLSEEGDFHGDCIDIGGEKHLHIKGSFRWRNFSASIRCTSLRSRVRTLLRMLQRFRWRIRLMIVRFAWTFLSMSPIQKRYCMKSRVFWNRTVLECCTFHFSYACILTRRIISGWLLKGSKGIFEHRDSHVFRCNPRQVVRLRPDCLRFNLCSRDGCHCRWYGWHLDSIVWLDESTRNWRRLGRWDFM